MKRFYFLIVLGLMGLPNFVNAQAKQDFKPAAAETSDSVKGDYRSEKLKRLNPKKKLKIANALAEKGSYYNALMYYQEVYDKKKDNVCAVYKLAKLNAELRDYQAAEKWYKTLYDMDTAKYVRAKYFQALMQKYNGKCEEAKGNFKSFVASYKDADKDSMKKVVDRQLQGCEVAIKTLSKPEKVLIDLLDKQVNNPFSDFAPHAFGKDQLIFSSLRSDTAIIVSDTSTNQKSHQFIATKSGDTWKETKLFDAAPNTPDFYTGNGVLSPDGQRFYFTNCKVGDKLEMECEIYSNKLDNGKWGTPVKLANNINDGSNNTHPFVANMDGKEVLLFTSNRKGGVGGKDIWMAEYDGKGGFAAPKNAGKVINTKDDEVTPSYDAKKKIFYFSSNGRVSIGGFDIYKSVYTNGTFGEPENMLAPINSSVDDIYFSLNDDNRNGYFVSNRPGGFSLKSPTCCDDIYHFKIVTDVILKGHVASRKDPKTPVEGADVTFFVKDNGTNVTLANLTTHKDEYFYVPLDPEKIYSVAATKSGFWGSDTTLDMPKINAKDTLEVTFFLDEIQRRKIQLKRIYYEFDKYNITREYKLTLDSLAGVLKDSTKWTIELYGYTDSVGSEDYNKVLGKKRAQAAADYLASKGIDINRMSLIAKGKEDYLAPNTTPDGKDNPAGRAKNRRVEYKINSNIKNNELEVEYIDNGPTDLKGGTKKKK